jgi:hypothetical protein
MGNLTCGAAFLAASFFLIYTRPHQVSGAGEGSGSALSRRAELAEVEAEGYAPSPFPSSEMGRAGVGLPPLNPRDMSRAKPRDLGEVSRSDGGGPCAFPRKMLYNKRYP